VNLRYMLDTDTASYLLKGTSPLLDARIRTLPPETLCISVVTRAELLYGLRLKDGATRLAKLIDQFLSRIHSPPWDAAAADQFSTIASTLTRSGTPIGTLDTMIAAHAAALGLVLVSNNGKHFSRVAELVVENWTVEY